MVADPISKIFIFVYVNDMLSFYVQLPRSLGLLLSRLSIRF